MIYSPYKNGRTYSSYLHNFTTQVIDNGKGIAKDDLRIVGKRNCTSRGLHHQPHHIRSGESLACIWKVSVVNLGCVKKFFSTNQVFVVVYFLLHILNFVYNKGSSSIGARHLEIRTNGLKKLNIYQKRTNVNCILLDFLYKAI